MEPACAQTPQAPPGGRPPWAWARQSRREGPVQAQSGQQGSRQRTGTLEALEAAGKWGE
jgi:hypothetical protein